MNKQEQPQPKRVNVGRGTYVMLVISGIMLLLGGLGAVYYQTTLYNQGSGAGFALFFYQLFLVFPLLAIGGILFLIGLIRLAKKMPKRSSIIASLVGVGLIVGLPIIGGVIAPSPLFLGPYPLSTYTYANESYDEVRSVAWSPDGKRIAAGGQDGTVHVWDAASGTTLYTFHSNSTWVDAVAWSPDGKRIASASDDKTVQVWNATDGRHMYTYRGHSDAVNAVAWSPDGKRIASGSDDHTVQVWDAADGRHVYTYRSRDFGSPAANDVTGVAWSPDGKYIASSYGYSVVVWDAISGSTVSTYTNPGVTALAWSPDGKRIASASDDKTVQVWDAISGSTISTYQRYYGGVTALAWSPDGRRIASGYDDGAVRIWDAS